jgi:hypothetical protein
MNIKPKETRYRGYRFRSRLEARWAVYFEVLGISWEYEPQGYELEDGISYLPDFFFPELKCFGEVKPGGFDDEALIKIRMLCKGTDYDCILLDGVPEVKTYDIVEANGCFKPVLLNATPTGRSRAKLRFYWADEPLDENDIEAHGPDIYPYLKRGVEEARGARFEFGESGCSQKQIDEYNTFASLSLDERRRRVYSRFITTFPNSPLTRDVLSGGIQLPKPRGGKTTNRKPKQKTLFRQEV